MRVGILGGVFNPPHVGHVVCAQEAAAELGLDEVLLIPAGEAPHREMEADPGAEIRLELCERAVTGVEWLSATRLELDRPGPSYTADTLDELARRRSDDEWVLILGADQAASLPSWHAPERVLKGATVAVVERKGLGRDEVRESVEGLPGAERLEFFSMPRIDVSSTLVRRRVREGRPIRWLVPGGVGDLIAARGLYGASGSAAPRGAEGLSPGTIATGAGAT